MNSMTNKKVAFLSKFRSKTTSDSPFFKIAVTNALVAFICTRAIIPIGYMADQISNGTPFHLCPSDARSAALSKVLVDERYAEISRSHHHHSVHELDEVNSMTEKDSASGKAGLCSLTNLSVAYLEKAYSKLTEPASIPNSSASAYKPYLNKLWARPSIRSPPKLSKTI